MAGILGLSLQPEALTRRRIAGEIKTALFGYVGAKDFASGLSDEENKTLLAALLGTDGAGLADFSQVVAQHVLSIGRRDDLRERIWQIEADITTRITSEVSEELEREMGALSPTRKTYLIDQRHFAAFCETLGIPAMPASAAAVAAYILDGCKPKLLRRRLAAIADCHRRAGHTMPAKHPLVRAALRHAMTKAEIQQPAKPLIAGQQEATRNG